MREYMQELNSNMSQWFTPAVKWLMYVCIGVFLLQFLLGRMLPLELWFAASPLTTLFGLRLWQLVTYAFLHGGPTHLLFNLLCLWFFGMRLEDKWGTERFVKFVIFTAAGAVLLHLLVATFMYLNRDPDAEMPGLRAQQLYFSIIGLSGVCYGIMLAFAYYWPDTPIYFWGIFPIKAKILVLILGLLVLFGSMEGEGPIAHFTHLGGLVFSFIFIKFQSLFDRIPMPRLPGARRATPYDERGRWRDF
ncbi:MAG: rhomboid family intramembrane serine protease [Candidatus Sumerlaeaceae bacterium]